MPVFLGVDGGQSTTKAVLADEHANILAQATGGPCDHTEEPGGPERLEQVIQALISRVLTTAKVPLTENQEFAGACFGMTGETEIKRQILERIVKAQHLSVVHDSVNALMGATAGEPGVIVIAGTGSVARGMDSSGKHVRVGGWGHLFGDEGSGYQIGREAVRAVAAEFDGFGQKTRLTPVLFGRLGVNSSYELMAKYYSGEWSRGHLAGLAGWVHEAAEGGDLIAQTVLREAGRELAELALAVISLLFPSETSRETAKDSEVPIVSYTGGVFRSQFVLSAMREVLLNKRPQAQIRPPLLPPVLGSLLLAYRCTGRDVASEISRAWLQTLARASRKQKDR